MAFKLFGFTLFSKNEIETMSSTRPSVVAPPNYDGAATVFQGGLGVFGGYSIDFDTYGAYTNEIDLINQYRDLSLQPEVDEAINDIMNELIVREDDAPPVTISVDALPEIYDETFRDVVREQFDHVLNLLHFTDRCYDIARQFYVDGRLFYDLIIDEENPHLGIVEVRNIDPRTIRPVRELRQNMHAETMVRLTNVVDEFFIYSPQGFRNMTNVTNNTIGSRLSKDRVAYINSGIYTPGNTMVLSFLHKAIKPFNQLRMVEDATVIYRLTRAPERRVFKIDVGDLPSNRAQAYLDEVAAKYRNRMVYDTTTGEVRDDRKVLSMLEDFFVPTKSNGRGSDITQLSGGTNLGEVADIDHFKQKLYRALNIPISRLENGGGQFQMGRTTEITRDEIKFSRFLTRLRSKISMLFDEIMERHLTLTGIIRSRQQWQELRKYIRYEYNTDSHFAELKKIEVLKERMSLLNDVNQHVGTYFSQQYVRDVVLGLTADDQKKIEDDIKKARVEEEGKKNDEGENPSDDFGGGSSGFGGSPPPPEPPSLGMDDLAGGGSPE